MIKDSKTFQAALDAEQLSEAEAWLEYVKANRHEFPQYDGDNESTIDHLERALFRKYRDKGEVDNARRVAENSLYPTSKEGRLTNLRHRAERSQS